MTFHHSSHKDAINENLQSFNEKVANEYDKRPSTQVLCLIFAKILLEYDPNTPRKSPEQSDQMFGNSDLDNNGLTIENTLPQQSILFKEGVRVLDFACGTGIVTEKLLPYIKGGEVTGIDINDYFLDIFNTRMKSHNANFKSANIDILHPQENIDSYTGYFDLIVCSISYHHLDDYESVTKKLATFLRPGGYLFIIDFYNSDVESKATNSGAVRHMGGLKISALEQTFSNSGLCDISVAREIKTPIWQQDHFILNHCDEETIKNFRNQKLPSMTDKNGNKLYLINSEIVMAVGRARK